MSSFLKNSIFLLFALVFLIACEDGPTIFDIPSDDKEVNSQKDYMPEELRKKDAAKEDKSKLHLVYVTEILPTSKYSYLNVTEGDDQFWVATRKKDVKVGETYSFTNGLLKTNFESKEYNRLFDKVYLVNTLVVVSSEDHSTHEEHANEEVIAISDTPLIERDGSMKISELLKDPKKYEGQTVQISGKCVKINLNIMKRNWIHIQDGTRNDYDLIITSDTFVPEGDIITIRAVVVLNKDFGAGYRYEVILENGVLVK